MTEPLSHQHWMSQALSLAQEAFGLGEIPVGALVVQKDQVIGQGLNRREMDQNPLAHAELMAIYQASVHLRNFRLNDCTLYVTLEPCPMCAGAIVNARIPRLVYGCKDPKAGAVESLFSLVSDPRLNHRAQIVSGVLETESSLLLKAFFERLRRT